MTRLSCQFRPLSVLLLLPLLLAPAALGDSNEEGVYHTGASTRQGKIRRGLETYTVVAGDTLFNITMDGIHDKASTDLSQLEMAMILESNRLRRNFGGGQLCGNRKLMEAARNGARTQARCQTMGHDLCDGSNMGSRVSGVGYQFRSVSENAHAFAYDCDRDWAGCTRIAYNGGSFTVGSMTTTIKGFMESPGHRDNILKQEMTMTGASAAKSGDTYYFTQVFAWSDEEHCDF